MNEKQKFVIKDKDGREIECEPLFTFESEETKKQYVVYTDNSKDDAGNIRVFASIYNVNDKESFEQIKNYWYPEIVKKNSKVIFALVGTFADVKDETKSVSEEEIKEFMTKTGILYEYKISSMNYENIKDVFNKIGECLLSIKP